MTGSVRFVTMRDQAIRLGFASLVFGILLVLVVAPAAAQSNETRVLLDRINRLEADINSLQRQVYRGEPPRPAAPAPGRVDSGDSVENVANRLSARLDEFESQIRGLTGRLEETDHRNVLMQRRLEKLVEDVDFRLSALERMQQAPVSAPAPVPPATAAVPPGQSASSPTTSPSREGLLGTMNVPRGPANGAAPGSAPKPPATAAVAPPKPASRLPQGTPQEQYNSAFALLRQGDNSEAEQAFREFIAIHPNDALVSNAKFWVGAIQLARNENEKAAATFLDAYQKHPKGNKAPDSLLKLGTVLTNLGQKQEACAVFVQLNKEFPNATAIRQEADKERARAGCR